MKRVWLKRILRWGSRALLVFVVLFVLFIAEENIRGRIALARYRAELRAKGEKLTLAEFDLPRPSSATSAAGALLEAADELVTFTNAVSYPPLELFMMQRIAPGRVMVLHQQEWPGNPRQPSLSWEKLSRDIAAVSNALDKARSAARQPTSAVALDYSIDLRGQLSHLGTMYRVSRWFGAAAISALHDGDLEVAMENVIAITDLTQMLKDQRVVGVQRTRLEIAAYGLKVTWQALHADSWTEPQLARLQESWQEVECLPDVVPSVEADRVTSAEYFNRDSLKDLLDGMKFMEYYTAELQQGWRYRLDTWQLTARWLIWHAAWFQQNELWTLHRWQETLDDARAVVDRKSWTAHSLKRERPWTIYDRWRYLVSYQIDTGGGEMGRAVRYETLREMAITAIALKRFQLRNGKFPTELSALIPEFLPDLPHDWMDGKPLRYRVNADGTFTLYSVGENGVDDGGRPDPSPVSWYLDFWGDGDEVWPAPATNEDLEELRRQWPRRSEQAQGSGRGRRLTEPKSH